MQFYQDPSEAGLPCNAAYVPFNGREMRCLNMAHNARFKLGLLVLCIVISEVGSNLISVLNEQLDLFATPCITFLRLL